MYLPPGWKHLTLNVGEAIGVGGQANMDARERYEVGMKALASNKDDFFGHKGAGLGLVHLGMERGDQAALRKGLSHLQRALAISPGHPEVSVITAEALGSIGRATGSQNWRSASLRFRGRSPSGSRR